MRHNLTTVEIMDRNLKKKVIPLLVELLGKFVPLGPRHIFENDALVSISLSRIGVDLPKDHVTEMYQCMRTIYYSGLYNLKISHNFFSSKFIDIIIANCWKDYKNLDLISNILDEFHTQLIKSIETLNIILPLENIYIKRKPIVLDNCKLFQMDADNLKYYTDLYDEILINTGGDEETKRNFRSRFYTNVKSDYGLMNKACFRIEVEAQQEKAVEIAISYAEMYIHVLTYCAINLSKTTQKFRISLAGQYKISRRETLILRKDNTGISSSSEWIGRTEELTIDEYKFMEMEQSHFNPLIEIVQKHKRNEVQNILLRAIRDFYNAIVSYDIMSEFINYIMILENFLSPENRKNIKRTISERVAYLLKDDIDERKELETYIKMLYKIRSDIVHGKEQNIYFHDLINARDICVNMISKIVENSNKWENKGDICSY